MASWINHPDGTKFYLNKAGNKIVISTDGYMKGQVFHVDIETGITSPVMAYDQEYTQIGLKILKQATEVAIAAVDAINAVKAGHYSMLSMALVGVIFKDNMNIPLEDGD